MQIRMDLFADIANQFEHVGADHPALVGALKFGIPIAEQYCRGEVERDDLSHVKDAALKEAGLFVRSKPLPATA